MASGAQKRPLEDSDEWRETECLKFLENVHEKFVADQKEQKSAKTLEAIKKKFFKKEPAKPAEKTTSPGVTTTKCVARSSSSSSYSSNMRARPIFWDPSGSVWAGVRTAIVGDSMLRGREMKKLFGSWAQVHVHEDREALAQPPPDDCDRVFYVSAGNALYKHRIMYADSAFKNIRTEEFLKKVGGVILLGSVELWDRLYAPTQYSGTTVNPEFFEEATGLLESLDIPVRQLDDDLINNLKYTTDVHPAPGQSRTDLAKHIEKNLVEMSQSAGHEKGIDERWMNEYRNACEKPTPIAKPREAGCKWCRRGECWDHQPSGGNASQASVRGMMNLMMEWMNDDSWFTKDE